MRNFKCSIDATAKPTLSLREPMGDELTGLSIADVDALIKTLQEQRVRLQIIDDAVSKPAKASDALVF